MRFLAIWIEWIIAFNKWRSPAEILCPRLSAPEFGEIAPCNDTVNSVCVTTCIAGFTQTQGSRSRKCLQDGTWSDNPATCEPCPADTYKVSERSCRPCPVNTNTGGMAGAAGIENCACDEGYALGKAGSCEDYNECRVDGDPGGVDEEGPCEDTCTNWPGGYSCSCTRPGYRLNEDRLTCYAYKQCRNLTEEDAPDHGGVVCTWHHQHSSQYCQVLCNDGYDFPAHTNEYETCGPTTGYTWSYQRVDPAAIIEPCIEEFFPGFRMEADSNYFVRNCHDLTAVEKASVKTEFGRILRDNNICVNEYGIDTCSIDNMAIICGTTQRRRKRGTDIDMILDEMDVLFNITALKLKPMTKDCASVCVMLKILQEECVQQCVPAYKRYLKAAVMYARIQLNALFANRSSAAMFRAAERTFEPDGIELQEVRTECAPGMRSQGELCIPCDVGRYYDADTNTCLLCPENTYQILPQQQHCIACPPGSIATEQGSFLCTRCEEGYYGDNCEQQCVCENGSCDPATGECVCPPGWEGERCHIDTDGCSSSVCETGLQCEDVQAPGTGYMCI